MEIKSKSSSNNMGDFRRTLLESASFDFAVAAKILNETGSLSTYRSVEALLDAFEFSIEPGSEAKKMILKHKDEAMEEKKERLQKEEINKQRLGYFERQDVEQTRERDIEIDTVRKRLEFCWSVAGDKGLFNDR
jgi:hypothetical protein